MKLFIIVHIIGAVVMFLALYVTTEVTTPDFVKMLARKTNQSYVKYGRVILISLIWELALIFVLLSIIGEIITAIIKISTKKGDK